MDLTQLHPDALQSLLKLSQEKASLLKQIEAIDEKITALANGKAPSRKASAEKAAPIVRKKAAKGPRTRRGSLKDQILGLLTKAGPPGTTVKEISEALGVKSQNIHVWFSSTGKKLPEVVKVGESRYALRVAEATQQLQPEA